MPDLGFLDPEMKKKLLPESIAPLSDPTGATGPYTDYSADMVPSSIAGIDPNQPATPPLSPGHSITDDQFHKMLGLMNPKDYKELFPSTTTLAPPPPTPGMKSNRMTAGLGTIAAALSPDSWGGRLGAGMAGLAEKDTETELKRTQLAMEQQKFGMEAMAFPLTMGEHLGKLQEYQMKNTPIGPNPYGIDPKNTYGEIGMLPPAMTIPHYVGSPRYGVAEIIPGQGVQTLMSPMGPTTTPSNLAKLQAELKNLTPGTPEYAQTEAAIKKTTQGTDKTKRDYVDPQGKTYLVDTTDPNAQNLINDKKLKPVSEVAATIRANIFASIPNQATGAYFDRATHSWKMPIEGGKEVTLSGEQVKQLGLEVKEQTPTERTKTMQQLAPRVEKLALSVQKDMAKEIKNLGPAASRWREFWQGTVGAPDPAFAKLKTDVGLLSTLLMNMHVGARGGQEMITRFENMIAVGKESPENMQAAIDTIIAYAKDTSESVVTPGKGSTPAANVNTKNDPLGIR